MKSKGLLFFNLIMTALIVIGDVLYMFVFPNLYMKGTASLMFVICAFVNCIVLFKKYNKKAKKYAIFMLIGVFFAMLGDILLGIDFVIGAGLFAVGHIFYFISFMFLQKYSIKDLILWLALIGISLMVILLPTIFNFKGMLPLIIAYAVIICGMLSKALSNFIFNKKYNNLQLGLILLGAFMFFFSDMMLMFYNFGFYAKVFDILCLSFYYPAQAVLATSVYYIYFMGESKTEHLSLAKKIAYRLYQICFRIILPILPYRQPKILNNYNALANVIKNNKIQKVLIVTDKSIFNLGLLDDIKKTFEEEGISYSIFDEVMPNPTIECVEKGRKYYIDNSCGGIIAFGGGSVMDCAKVIGARLVKPKQPVSKMKGLLKIRKRLPLLVAIPTTAGTGSETTLTAVITDEKTHYKYPINDFCLIPHFALLDSNVTLGLPKSLTATTGMDALTHAIEAYIGRSTTRYTRKMAIGAVSLIVDNLHICYQNGIDFDARKNMLKAAFMAGNAFTRSYVGYVHAIAHSVGGEYGVPHGFANAIILPKVLRTYGKSCYKKLANLAKICGIADVMDSKEIASNKFITYIEQINKDMCIPEVIDAIKKEDIKKLAERAEQEANPLYPVPKLFSKFELEEIYKNLV